MHFGRAIDFYENNGVVFDLVDSVFYSEKGNKFKKNYCETYVTHDFKLVALPNLDNFSAGQIVILKDVLNDITIFPIENISTLNHHLRKLFDAFWLKDNDKINDSLQTIFDFTVKYSIFN